MNTRVIRLELYHAYLTRTAAVCAGLCALSVFLYGAFLLLAVSHAAARTQAMRGVAAIAQQVSSMEMRYLQATKELTPDRAVALGFVAPTETKTVFATAAAHALSLNTLR